MCSFATSFKAYEVQVVLALAFCLSIAFLVCFLVVLVQDEMRMRTKRSWALSKRNHQVRFAIHNQHCQVTRVWSNRDADGRPGPRAVKTLWLILGIPLSTTIHLAAQNANQTQPTPSPSPLSTPSITGPLQAAAPIEFDAGPLGKLDLDGIVSGMGLLQGNHVAGDEAVQAALSNAQVWIQKTT